jgi:hypothetical protein
VIVHAHVKQPTGAAGEDTVMRKRTTNIGGRVYKLVRSRTPRPVRRPLARTVEEFSALTSFVRTLPSFIIVGGQRCGTNSLYEYLVAHPNVRRALPGQEIHFFDLNMDRGMSWYRGHFPIRVSFPRKGRSTPFITGECSPYYMFHPAAPHRIAEALPDVKLFVLLRNPVDRAFSHYQHERSRGFETLTFEEAIDREPERLQGEEQRLRPGTSHFSFIHQHFSYLARGRYADQLKMLFSLFPRQNIMVLFSEELFDDPAAAHSKALRFLELPAFCLREYPTHNPGSYGDMDPRLRLRLTELFAEENERLYRMLDTDFRWD